MAHGQVQARRIQPQVASKVCGTKISPQSLEQLHISGGKAGPIISTKQGKTETLSRLSGKVRTGGNHLGAKKEPQHEESPIKQTKKESARSSKRTPAAASQLREAAEKNCSWKAQEAVSKGQILQKV